MKLLQFVECVLFVLLSIAMGVMVGHWFPIIIH